MKDLKVGDLVEIKIDCLDNSCRRIFKERLPFDYPFWVGSIRKISNEKRPYGVFLLYAHYFNIYDRIYNHLFWFKEEEIDKCSKIKKEDFFTDLTINKL